MDIFCKNCASKPGWPFDEQRAFFYSCQRCFMQLPCNDYSHRKTSQGLPVTPGAAPLPKDLVKTQINPQAQADLPKAKPVEPQPQPVYPVEPPNDISKALSQDELLNELAGGKRKGFVLERVKKNSSQAQEPVKEAPAAIVAAD